MSDTIHSESESFFQNTQNQIVNHSQASQIIVWKIQSPERMSISKTAWLAEGLRRSLMSRVAARLGSDQIPTHLSGHGSENSRNFPHSSYLPLDLDFDGYLDHVALLIPETLSDSIRTAALGLQHIRLYGEGVIVAPIYFGAQEHSPILGRDSANIWVTVSPWAHPWHLKKKFGLAEQLSEELRRDGFPEPVAVEFSEHCYIRGSECNVRSFPYRRPGRELVRHSVQLKFARITFMEPVVGPLLLGKNT